jgi:hypothetical protein
LKPEADATAAHENDTMRLFAVFVDVGGASKWVEVPTDLQINRGNMSAQLAFLKGLPAFRVS